MTLNEIKEAVNSGKTVYCNNPYYRVIQDSKGQWFIKCITGSCIGLTWSDKKTLNDAEEAFYIKVEN